MWLDDDDSRDGGGEVAECRRWIVILIFARDNCKIG